MAKVLSAILVLVFLLSGCSMTEESLPDDISGALEKTDGYYAELEATVVSAEGEQTYQIKQWMEAANWRVEVTSETASQIFICDGMQIYVYQPGIEDYYRLDANTAADIAPPFFLVNYLTRLLHAEGYTFEGRREQDGQQYDVVSFRARENEEMRLWLNPQSHFPMIVETFLHGELLNRVVCTHLEVNPSISSELFSFNAVEDREVNSSCQVSPISIDEAHESWPYPVYTPEYLPEGSFLFLISRSEDKDVQQLLFIYKGKHHFTLVQSPNTDMHPHLSEATEEVTIGENLGYYHPNLNDDLATLWWSNETTTFILTGNLPQEEMVHVAQTLKVE